jgi:GT2 family glycosyltransferase
MDNSIEIVSASRSAEAEFGEARPLGRSWSRLSGDLRLSWNIQYSNTRGLPDIYNNAIDSSESDILVFVHDDVWLEDFFLADHVVQGLSSYDVVGVAGSRRIVPNQPSWYFTDDNFTPDVATNLSGAVAHGPCPFGNITRYGDFPAECELLDGVLLAARAEVLKSRSVYFDRRFDFHFYDLDFCRTARSYGLRLGTWTISITHSGLGAFGSPSWIRNRDKYREKWTD